MQQRGFLLILSGPSGAGKNTVLDAVRKRCPDLVYSVSATTRPCRPLEKDGRDYFFLTKDEFQQRVEAGEFLEWAEFCGHCYGTPLIHIRESLDKGQVVVMDIDIQGARQVKKKMPEAVFVFLLPPTMAELEKRLRGRSSDSDEAIRRRLNTALAELKAGIEYDYAIRNDQLERAAAKLQAIIIAERCRVRRSEYSELLEEIVGEQGVISEDDEPATY
ncbi:MAG: guanylate kinase [Firmicutes bacterium]|nr:guanylate kinase [Bacillota bacterium]